MSRSITWPVLRLCLYLRILWGLQMLPASILGKSFGEWFISPLDVATRNSACQYQSSPEEQSDISEGIRSDGVGTTEVLPVSHFGS